MSVNTTLAGLSQTASNNGPDGTVDPPSTIDDAVRYALSFIAQLRDGVGFTSNFLPGLLYGCTLSTAGSSATMSISAGKAQDSTGVQQIAVSAISKTTSAWTLGTAAGGLDTGTIANNTGYHWFVIRRPDSGVVDALCSLSATAPTLPTNYTQFRRIGWGRTNGSAQWTNFVQLGDKFFWMTPPQDVAATNPGTAAVTRTLSIPAGVTCEALIQAVVGNTGAAGSVFAHFSDLNTTDTAPTINFTDTVDVVNTAGGSGAHGSRLTIRATNAQIRSRLSFSDANTTIVISTLGWIDSRGRDA